MEVTDKARTGLHTEQHTGIPKSTHYLKSEGSRGTYTDFCVHTAEALRAESSWQIASHVTNVCHIDFYLHHWSVILGNGEGF